jgi:hypothetical protein
VVLVSRHTIVAGQKQWQDGCALQTVISATPAQLSGSGGALTSVASTTTVELVPFAEVTVS